MSQQADEPVPRAAAEHGDDDHGATSSLCSRFWRQVDANVESVASFYVARPCVSFGSCIVSMLALTLLSIASGCMKMHLEVSNPWSVMESDIAQQYVMILEAENSNDASDAENITLLTKAMRGTSFLILYKSSSGGQIFNPEALRDMCKFERVIFQSRVYKDFCRRTETGSCLPFSRSVLQLFYNGGNLSSYEWECDLLDSNFVTARSSAILSDVAQNGRQSVFSFYLDENAISQGYTIHSRSLIQLGYPSAKAHQKYLQEMGTGQSARDASRKALKVYKDELTDKVSNVEQELFKVPDEEMKYGPAKLRKSAYVVDDDQFTSVGAVRVRFQVPYQSDMYMIQSDFLFALLSVLFVWGYMCSHLGSIFKATIGMLQIVCSLPLAGLLYQGLFQVNFFQFIHILTIFLALGIGADDIFVFNDTWIATASLVRPGSADGRYTYEELQQRMRITYTRTASAIFNTSLTTATAFMSCSVSKVMPMRTNGWYAALAVVINYVLTVALTPATTMIYHYKLEGKRGRFLLSRLRLSLFLANWSCARVCVAPAREPPDTRPPLLERLLRDHYIPAMRYKYVGVRIVPLFVIVVLVATGLQGVIFASQLTPPLSEEVWFPDNHMHNHISLYMRDTYFGVVGDGQATVALFWGIKGLDRSTFNAYDPWDTPGRPIYDERFNLSRPEAQQAILSTCQKLRELPCNLEGCRAAAKYGGTLALGTNYSVACFLEDFGKWLEQKRAATGAPGGASLPQGQEFFDELQLFRRQARPTSEQREEADADWESQVGFINGELKYVSVRFRSTMPMREPVGTGKKVSDLIDDFAQQQLAASPPSAAGPKGASRYFLWFTTAEELIAGFFSGCALAGPVAFVVLVCATRNLIIASYAVLCVSGVVVCVLGFSKSAMGWSLGIGESIAGVVIIGLAVDYVVHLAHMYIEADRYGHKTRDARSTFAIENMGVTIFAGAITTAGAGAIMLLCFSTFFHKMAVLMSITIMFSFLFSLGLFMSLLYVAGPQGSSGDLSRCAAAVKAIRPHHVKPEVKLNDSVEV